MGSGKVLLAENDPDSMELLMFHLTQRGYEVESVRTGEQALVSARSLLPDVVALDRDLPGLSGLDVCGRLREDPQTKSMSIILISQDNQEAHVVEGLERGADDYVSRPISPRVFVARVQAVLRQRAGEKEDQRIRVGDIRLHTGRYDAAVGERQIKLTPLEFRLLTLLARSPGRTFTRTEILRYLNGDESGSTERSVDVLVAGLREKLGEAANYVETMRGAGYRLSPK